VRVVPEPELVFDEVADLYDRVRPGYPSALIDDAITLAAIAPSARVLEIGSGTGKATEAFVRRGLRVVGIEPGASLARVARQRLAGTNSVTIIERSFEAWPLEPEAFDLVVVAQAFHWLSPEIRFIKAAATLRPGGALAVFGSSPVIEDSPRSCEVNRVYERFAPAIRQSIWTQWYADETSMRARFEESARFEPVTVRVYPWNRTYEIGEYLDLLRTYSDHRRLPDAEREALLEGIRAVIMQHGETITMRYQAHLYLAKRCA
jgi:SAM-dependent methyltransferase